MRAAVKPMPELPGCTPILEVESGLHAVTGHLALLSNLSTSIVILKYSGNFGLVACFNGINSSPAGS